MAPIIQQINEWEGDEPGFYQVFFSSWVTYLLLVAVYRSVFHIRSDLVPEYRLCLVQYFACLSWVFDKYFNKSSFGRYLLYGYLFIVYIIFLYFLIAPILRYPYARYYCVYIYIYIILYILYMCHNDDSYETISDSNFLNVWPIIVVD